MFIDIYGDTRRRGYCPHCGAAIEWATVVSSDRTVPFDAPIAPIRIEAAIYGDEREVLVLDSMVTKAHVTTCAPAIRT